MVRCGAVRAPPGGGLAFTGCRRVEQGSCVMQGILRVWLMQVVVHANRAMRSWPHGLLN